MEENQMFEMEESGSDLGKVEISPEVIEIIASLAATEVEGVASMHGGFATGVVEKISRRSYGKGVKVDLTDEGILVDVQLHMNYGVSIPEVGQKVQDNIMQTLKTMTALDVKAINIHVVGIQFEQQEKKVAEDIK
ncbi:putative alkaline shock family protein YloU [Scopulibacillus darangshiensis]|uniref:Putative alkaline shock family protein YloU n=1 Tax=Scopulibacillus darangshiensis TaxID=442528 RepID=A0A4R2P8C5_9BACL|nr:Asp23/Gls24 family envelope stress response protein [Scopulibacillus darangshiensis]TCP31183.1 putative alkaline shock family protein YloU [Scopulibacillus darangshiensis]